MAKRAGRSGQRDSRIQGSARIGCRSHSIEHKSVLFRRLTSAPDTLVRRTLLAPSEQTCPQARSAPCGPLHSQGLAWVCQGSPDSCLVDQLGPEQAHPSQDELLSFPSVCRRRSTPCRIPSAEKILRPWRVQLPRRTLKESSRQNPHVWPKRSGTISFDGEHSGKSEPEALSVVMNILRYTMSPTKTASPGCEKIGSVWRDAAPTSDDDQDLEAEETDSDADVKKLEEVVEISVLWASEHECNEFAPDRRCGFCGIRDPKGSDGGLASKMLGQRKSGNSRRPWKKKCENEFCIPSLGRTSLPNN